MFRLAPQTYACILITALLLSATASLVNGAMNIPFSQSLLTLADAALSTSLSNLKYYQQAVIMELRLPRLLMAVAVGAILAQCGAIMQGLFRNPLADPGIIGVSSGAALGAIIAIVALPTVALPTTLGIWGVPFAAFVGGLVTTLLVYQLARSDTGTSVLMLLLSGIAISAFSGAMIGFMSYFTSDEKLRELSLWQMGSLAGAGSANLWLWFSVLTLISIAFYRSAGALDALLLGEPEARHMGIPVERLKLQLIILTAIGVGCAVALSGVIGFVGLVVPHLVRMVAGPGHRSLLPLSALLGALLLVMADLFSRLMVQPAELPIGLVTALIGAPFFLALLIQQRRHWK